MDNELELVSQELTSITEKYADKLDDEQLEIIPLLASGMSVRRAADYSKIQQSRIRKWIENDRVFNQALQEFKARKDEYHRQMLDQAGTLAWSRIMEYLGEEVPFGDSDRLKIQASIAKFIVSELSLKTQKSEIIHEVKPSLHVTEDSAGIIARKLKELQDGGDVIDSEYRIALENIPAEQDKYSGMDVAKSVDSFDGKDFDEEIKEIQSDASGNYVTHPECDYGVLEYDESKHKFRCHVCGKYTKDLVVHIRTEHKISPGRYRNMYGLDKDTKFFIEQPQTYNADGE